MQFQLVLFAAAFFSVQAFKDASPFVLLSSSSLSESSRQTSPLQLGSREYVLNTTKALLSNCPSEFYFIITQQSTSALELSNEAPFISQAFSDPRVRSRFLVSETVTLKKNDGDELVQYLEQTCGSKKANGWAINEIESQREKDGSLIAVKKFEGEVMESDTSIHTSVLSDVMNGYKYTIILLTTPHMPDEEYPTSNEASPVGSVHIELKREPHSLAHNVSAHADLRPIFEKYQFLSSGLFVGIMVTVLLVAILSVGVRAIASLEVSYGAFVKENGPSMSKGH